jgi:hypothetical protein
MRLAVVVRDHPIATSGGTQGEEARQGARVTGPRVPTVTRLGIPVEWRTHDRSGRTHAFVPEHLTPYHRVTSLCGQVRTRRCPQTTLFPAETRACLRCLGSTYPRREA